MRGAVFHEGELAWQRREGSYTALAEAGPRVIRDHLPQQHRDFFAQLPFLVLGALDAGGQPWASVLCGAPGFAHSPDPRELVVGARPLQGDPLAPSLQVGAALGLLGIEPHTRRRNRLNGHLTRIGQEGLVVRVDQSFGNCPKYIQARKPEFIAARHGAARPARWLRGLDAAAWALVARADTFYIATAHPAAAAGGEERAWGVDVSHRGGKPGFVRVEGASRLTVPDFAGNRFFQTFGNLALDPRCGLLFLDFPTGDLLYLAARAEVIAAGPELAAFQGAERLLQVEVIAAVWLDGAMPLRWGEPQLSPHLAATGHWA